MDNSYCYFENRDCKYYPCHEGIENLNCLFCYCPLYQMEHCPGDYRLLEKEGRRIKTCIDCSFPHHPENYDKINQIIKHNNQKNEA